jgi:hypothetical protein
LWGHPDLCYFVPFRRESEPTPMPRKPSAILDYKLRIRESLRRKIEQAAKKGQVSMNYEMASRLERSFEQDALRSIDEIRGDLDVIRARVGEAVHDLNLQGDLVRAVEALIEQLPTTVLDDPSGRVGEAVAGVQRALKMIDMAAARAVRRMHTV